ncbi:ABC transporter ATP-binding protein [Anaerovorax odorimutans]|uniref:ABC transporter ATP-binding protein n=1 Tax=Anaerovorax odorimutans TaxID=109327 RepID=UPI00040FB81A|nr:ABC transporter ATP-binding protein [Anaerovorax odorimutans]
MNKQTKGNNSMRFGPGRAAVPGEKPKNFKKTMKALLSYLKPYRLKLVFIFIFAIASTIFSIVSPKILGSATDYIVDSLKLSGMVDFSRLFYILTILGALYLLSSLFLYIQSFMMIGISQKVTYALRKDMSEKMDRLPLKYFDSKTHGEILSRVTNDIETINTTLGQSLTQIVTNVCTLVGVLVMMLSINWIMTLVALLILPLSSGLIMLIVKRSQKYFANQQKFLGEINGHIEEMYTGHIIVKAFNGEEDSIKKFEKVNNKLYNSAWKSQFFSGLMMPMMNFVGNLAFVFVCVVGGLLAARGSVSIGQIQAFLQYIKQFNHPIAQIANVVNVLQSTAAAAERVLEFVKEEEELSEENKHAKIDQNKFKGDITFNNLSFGYNEDTIIINDFNCEVKSGQKVAIVGPTGAGKTTLVKILMRFYELNKGSIEIDGVNISDMSRDNLRALFGMVLQDTWLFNGTIMENIRYGNLEASDEEVYKAAKAAHIDHFINTLPQGYETVINEEASNISQGEKQLLTIARAILSNRSIMILDEATSSVDTRTEILIQMAMNNLMHGRTSFIIAHRLSTIKDADVILVINNGDIVEKGSHEELMKRNGFYANLYNSQFKQ